MTTDSPRKFRVALTADFFDKSGALKFVDVGLKAFEAEPGIQVVPMARFCPVVQAEQLESVQGAVLMEVGVDKASVSKSEDLLALARFGVGYNDVDVRACTEADVLFFTAAGAVDHSMAEATIAWMLALAHRVRSKDMLVRSGDWARAHEYVGWELRARVFGSVGFGGIAKKAVQLLQSFSMAQFVAFDPYADMRAAESLGVRLVSLDELLRIADFVSVHCPLTAETRNLIGERELRLMKPGAVLINTARGGIVNEDALFNALKAKQIAGAALDVFVGEPFDEPHRFSSLDNVLLAPHAIGLTHEIFRDIGWQVATGMTALAAGRRPLSIINPEVLGKSSFTDKWKRLRL